MGVKLAVAGLLLGGLVAVGCESNEHHHSNRDYSKQPVGYGSGGYYGSPSGGYYDRNGNYHRWNDNARPAGGQVDPYYRNHDYDRDRDGNRNGHYDRDHDNDRDGNHNHDRDHDGDHDRD